MNKKHAFFISIATPILLTFVLPTINFFTEEKLTSFVYRNPFEQYLCASLCTNLLIALTFSACICYLIWFSRNLNLANKKKILANGLFANISILIIILGLSVILDMFYLQMAFLKYTIFPVTTTILYFILWKWEN